MFKVVTVCLAVGAVSVVACSDDSGDSGHSGDGNGGDSEEVQAFCDELSSFVDKHGASGPIMPEDLGVDEEWMKDFQAITPMPDVADDWEAWASDFAAYEEALADVDVDSIQSRMEDLQSSDGVDIQEAEAIMSEASEAMAVLQTEEHVEVSNRINNYTNEQCEIGIAS